MQESFEVREIAEQPKLTMRKQRTWGGIALRIGFGVLVFAIGTGCGWLFHVKNSDQQLKKTYVMPDIAVELEAGIDDVITLFPENADSIRAQREIIVSYMLNMTDPPEDSPLQKKALLESHIASERRLELQGSDLGVSELADVDAANLETCLSSVGDFVHEFMNFVAGFARFRIPSSAKFKKHMSRWLRHRYAEFQIAKIVSAVVFSEEVHDKVEAMWTFVIQSRKTGGGVMKALYDWLAQELTTWQAVKAVVKLAVVLYGWLKGGFMKFFGDLTFFEENFKRMVKAGRNVMNQCNLTMSFPSIGGDKGRFLLN